MEINLTFSENRAIRVVIMPVGEISPEKYREYSSLIKTINVIELSSITRSPNDQTPLEKISWVDGNMLLNFIESAHYSKNEYEDIQLFKKVFGVIGIADCKRSKNLIETKKKFEDAVSKYPSAVSSLCCAFDPSDDQPDLDLGENLIMIPNNSDKKHLIFYLTTLLIDFSHMILKHFEKMISEHETSLIVTTPLDQYNKVWDEVKGKKRKPGRLYKLKGDYCLLSGSPLDAIRFYDLSIELTKTNNDLEWLASSYEGYITAIILKRNQEFHSQQHTLSPTSIQGNYLPDSQIQVDDQSINAMAFEAISSYNKKKTTQFEIEISLKFANYHVSMDRKIEASNLLSTTYDLLSELPPQEKILVTCSIALIYYSMKYKRKFAFYIREAIHIYNPQENWDKIRNLFVIASPFYQLGDLFPHNPVKFLDDIGNKEVSFTLGQMKMSKSKSSKPASRSTAGGNQRIDRIGRAMPQLSIHKKKEGWLSIQSNFLFNMIYVSQHLNDSLSVCKYIIYLLRTQYQYKHINQQKYLEDFVYHSKYLSVSINSNVHMNSLGLPFLVRVVPMALPSHLQPVAKPAIQAVSAQPNVPLLIYSPYEKEKSKKQSQILWVEDECNVLVTLSNPFTFETLIQSLSLSTAGVPFESYPLTLKALPHTDRFEVVLTGRPLRPGPLIIKGVFIRSFGILSEHPINPYGNGISLSEYHSLCKKDAYKVESYDTVGLPTSPPSPPGYNGIGAIDDDVVNKITVVPKMPILNLQLPSFGNRLDLFAGEEFTFNWVFENIGVKSIDHISITLAEFDKNLRKSVIASNSTYIDATLDEYDEFTSFSWNREIIKKNLPLLPNQSFVLPITVHTKPYLIGNQFNIEYYNFTDEYQRKISVLVPLNIIHGPQISNFDIVYSSLSTIHSINSFLITNNILSQSQQPQQHVNPNQSDHCLLVFDVKNVSSTHSFTIYHEGNENVKFSLPPNSTISVLVPMKKEPFPDTLPLIRLPKGQYIKPKNKLTKHEKYLNRLIQYYKDFLIQSIKLKWISSDNTNGTLFINNINLTPKLVHKLKSDPIEIEFTDNQIQNRSVKIGEFVSINVKLTNVSRTTLTGLVLHIQPTCDKLSNDSASDLNNRLAYIGSLSHPIQQLPAHSTYNHSMNFVFFVKDIYKFIVTCELGHTKEAIPSPNPYKVEVI